ncbi:MAG: hypothetical protein IK031_02255 [Bacteroidales bacterium]|nr:hypothetical protein [Bacteroidales bacterium]
MRKCVLLLMVLGISLGFVSCGSGDSATSAEAPELLKAVPSDALAAGIFGRLDRGLERMTDSTSILRSIDYGRLGRARTVIALCDVSSLVPLVIIEAGKASPDTLAAAESVMVQADSLRLSRMHATLDGHNVLLLSPSETVITIAGRHLQSGSSILDAPDFDRVAAALHGGDQTVYRSRGASKLFADRFQGSMRAPVLSFIRDASEWMVASDDAVVTVQPETEKYFCNFCSSLEAAPSRFGAVVPEGAEFCIDIPVASVKDYRSAYELWLDARVALESYNARLSRLGKAGGKDPRVWEKELDVREVAMADYPFGRLNFLRVKDKAKTDGVVVNPWTGYVQALYGNAFNPADSCMMRSGNWIISGSRKALDSLAFDAGLQRQWPAKAKAVAGTPAMRLAWDTDNNIKIWHSNQ